MFDNLLMFDAALFDNLLMIFFRPRHWAKVSSKRRTAIAIFSMERRQSWIFRKSKRSPRVTWHESIALFVKNITSAKASKHFMFFQGSLWVWHGAKVGLKPSFAFFAMKIRLSRVFWKSKWYPWVTSYESNTLFVMYIVSTKGSRCFMASARVFSAVVKG